MPGVAKHTCWGGLIPREGPFSSLPGGQGAASTSNMDWALARAGLGGGVPAPHPGRCDCPPQHRSPARLTDSGHTGLPQLFGGSFPRTALTLLSIKCQGERRFDKYTFCKQPPRYKEQKACLGSAHHPLCSTKSK